MDGYIRVSQVAGRGGPRFISPKVQREQIELWASVNKATLGEVFEELDQSGARADRPLLVRALERIETRESDGLIVAKLDRFGRSLIDGLAAIARIEAVGGLFVSVQDGFDLSTPTGKLLLRMLFSMGEWELDRVRANWDIARAEAIGRGVYMSAHPPLGYQRGEDGCLRPDHDDAPLLAEAYRKRAAGETVGQIAEFMNQSKLKSHSGHPFTPQGVLRLMQNRAYLGEARSHPYTNSRAHPAIVDGPTWQLAQHPRRRAFAHVESLLAGLLRCAGCGRPMTHARPGTADSLTAFYHCSGNSRFGAKGCAHPARARAEELEPLVETLLFELAAQPQPGADADVRLAKCLRQTNAARRKLGEYVDDFSLQRSLGASTYEAEVAKRRRRLQRLLLRLAQAKRAAQPPVIESDDLAADWPLLSLSCRRAALAEFFDCIVIERGPQPIGERARICARGCGPLEVGRGKQARPIDCAKLDQTAMSDPPRWSGAKIESELRTFLGARTLWPRYPEFQSAGRARLHAQMMRWGGPYYWAHRFGLEIPPRFVVWNETRVHDALAPFLCHRKRWPSREEFKAAGLLPLRLALNVHGGISHWAEVFGLHYTATQKVWSKQAVEKDLRQFLGDRRTFPRKREFSDAGRLRLYAAIRANGGQPYWMRRLGLVAAERPKKDSQKPDPEI